MRLDERCLNPYNQKVRCPINSPKFLRVAMITRCDAGSRPPTVNDTMSRYAIERYLPADLLEMGTLRGNEYAWRLKDIPFVIDAVRKAGLANLGGQLQFRVPGEGTCEAYQVSVYPYRAGRETRTWNEFVERSAVEALKKYYDLFLEHDFLAELRFGFAAYIDEFQAAGHDPADGICFVWYAAMRDEYEQIHKVKFA